MTEANSEYYHVVFSGKCEEAGQDIKFAQKNGKLCVTANVAAPRMDEEITAELQRFNGESWETVDKCTCSVNDYLENAEPEEGWSDEKKEAFDKLVDTVRLYGKASYAYFNTPDNMPEVTDHYVDILQGEKDYDAYCKYNTATAEDNFDTEETDLLSLTLNSRLSMRLYLDGLADGDEAQLRDINQNGYLIGSYTPITAKTSRFGPYYEITGISPLRMNSIREIRFNGFTYQFTPLTWCCRMKEYSEEYRDYVMADILYEYYIDAEAFSEAN